MNKGIRILKIILSSLSIYYFLCMQVEELFWLICFMIGCVYYVLEKEDKNEESLGQKIVFIVTGCYISLCLTLGLCYYEQIPYGVVQWIIIWAGLFLLFYEGMEYLYSVCDRISTKRFMNKTSCMKRSWKKIAAISLLLFASWLPMLLANYPGILMYDSTEQWHQAVGEWDWSNHHPVWHTLVVKLSVSLCNIICGEVVPEYGVLIYSLLQMMAMAFLFSLVLEWLYESGIPKAFWLAALLYYLILPIHAIQAVSMVKDSLFGTFILLFTAQIYQLYYSDGMWGQSRKNIIGLILTMLGVVFFRNNGFAVVMVAGLAMFFLFKNIRRQLVIAGAVVAVSFVLQNTVVFHVLDIRQTKLEEAIGMPINQIANIVCHDRNLTDEEKMLIETVMPLEDIKANYDIHYSDGIKFHENYKGYVVEQNKKDFLKLWVILACKYPADCIEASLNLTIGFWYPGVSKGAVSAAMTDEKIFLEDIGVYPEQLHIRSGIFDVFTGDKIRENLLFSGFFSIGNMVILMFLLCAFLIRKKGWKIISIFLPCITVWLTLLAATPSFCETRYIYSLFAAIPVFAAVFGKEFLSDGRNEITTDNQND